MLGFPPTTTTSRSASRPATSPAPSSPRAGVTIYRDTHDVPHIYGNTDAVDGLRRRLRAGRGPAVPDGRAAPLRQRHAAPFLGSSCEFEQMDHDQLLLSAYTPAQAQAQVDALPKEYGAQGAMAKSLIDNFVAGRQRLRRPDAHQPGAAARRLRRGPDRRRSSGPTPTSSPSPGSSAASSARAAASRSTNAALLQYLQKQLGTAAGASAFQQFKEQNDPAAADHRRRQAFPYEIAGKVNPATTAMPDNARAPLTGGPTDHHAGLQPHRARTRRRPRS